MKLVREEIIKTVEEGTAKPRLEETRKITQEESEAREQEDGMSVMRPLIVIATSVLWCLLVVLGLASVWEGQWQSRVIESATKVLLPLFNATIVASLTYVFGKPVAKAAAYRLSRPKV